MSLQMVSSIDTLDFGAVTVRIGDLNGDGAPDLLFVQSTYDTCEIRCLTATTIHGERLWQVGTPSADNGSAFSDLPVQIYDLDNDGANEVLYIRQATYAAWSGKTHNGHQIRERAERYEGTATMIVLDASTGREKMSFPLPAPADDCFALADLTGRGRREDFVVKDRYWNIWGVARSGDVLWHRQGSVGHYPAIADIDNDGCDEVFLGYSLLDHNGELLFEHTCGWRHQDASCAIRHPDGSWRLLFGNGGVHCLTTRGETLWKQPVREAQHVVTGHFLGTAETQVAVMERGDRRNPASTGTVYLYDIDGRELWRREQPAGSWVASIVPLMWTGRGTDLLVSNRGPGQPTAVLNGAGEIVDLLPMVSPEGCPVEDGHAHSYGRRADVWGDSRDEVLLYGGPRRFCIWANARPLAVPTLYNDTLYHGM